HKHRAPWASGSPSKTHCEHGLPLRRHSSGHPLSRCDHRSLMVADSMLKSFAYDSSQIYTKRYRLVGEKIPWHNVACLLRSRVAANRPGFRREKRRGEKRGAEEPSLKKLLRLKMFPRGRWGIGWNLPAGSESTHRSRSSEKELRSDRV